MICQTTVYVIHEKLCIMTGKVWTRTDRMKRFFEWKFISCWYWAYCQLCFKIPWCREKLKKVPKANRSTKTYGKWRCTKILKAKETDIAKEVKRLEKLSKTKKAAPKTNELFKWIEAKICSSKAVKSKKFNDFLLCSEDSTSDSDSTIIK